VRIVVDDKKAQAVEVDADHKCSWGERRSAQSTRAKGKVLPLRHS